MSTTFPVYGIQYSQVCGRIVGYQVGTPNAFFTFSIDGQNIDGYYLGDISLTHGQSPRQHIWSFVGAVGEGYTRIQSLCPCTRNTSIEYVPPFVGSDYFCDTAIRDNSWQEGVFYSNDPHWDGQGCESTSIVAVSSTIHHGSAKHFPSQLWKILS